MSQTDKFNEYLKKSFGVDLTKQHKISKAVFGAAASKPPFPSAPKIGKAEPKLGSGERLKRLVEELGRKKAESDATLEKLQKYTIRDHKTKAASKL